MLRPGFTKTPPLKPATMVSIFRSSISIFIPRGGRPLVIVKAIFAARSAATAARARAVTILSLVMSAPSTSASMSEILAGLRYGFIL